MSWCDGTKGAKWIIINLNHLFVLKGLCFKFLSFKNEEFMHIYSTSPDHNIEDFRNHEIEKEYLSQNNFSSRRDIGKLEEAFEIIPIRKKAKEQIFWGEKQIFHQLCDILLDFLRVKICKQTIVLVKRGMCPILLTLLAVDCLLKAIKQKNIPFNLHPMPHIDDEMQVW